MSSDPPSSLVILSPHRDDAAFSTGSLLLLSEAASLPLTILNVFTRSSYAPFDKSALSTEAVTDVRLAEDRAMLSLIAPSVTLLDLALLDAPLRLHIGDDQVISDLLMPEQLASQVDRVQAELPDLSHAAMLLVPLALGAHIDHLITRDAGINAVPADRIGFYQDLPYASRIPSAEALHRETVQILTVLAARTHTTLSPYTVRDPDNLAKKRQLVASYPSQIAPETMDEIANWTHTLGGERLYLCERAATHLAALLPPASLERFQAERSS